MGAEVRDTTQNKSYSKVTFALTYIKGLNNKDGLKNTDGSERRGKALRETHKRQNDDVEWTGIERIKDGEIMRKR
jgi:hypothetical protein